MKKSNVGRPTLMTEDTLKKLEDAFMLGCTDLEACLAADISTTTLYNYQNEHPEFVERKATLKENPIKIARVSVIKQMTEDGDLALKFLERKKKDEFSLRTELTGKDGGQLFDLTSVLNGLDEQEHSPGEELETKPNEIHRGDVGTDTPEN
jgi:hypothetical protein